MELVEIMRQGDVYLKYSKKLIQSLGQIIAKMGCTAVSQSNSKAKIAMELDHTCTFPFCYLILKLFKLCHHIILQTHEKSTL